MLEKHDKMWYPEKQIGGDTMEIRTLNYFLAVASEENITNAARKLHMTQPSLSRQMMELERELGKPLFIRTNKKTMLTEDGVHLKQRAQEILSLVEKTATEFRSTWEEIYGEVSIGAGETDVMRRFAQVMKHIQELHPRITFSLYSGNAEDILEKLSDGLLDFGLVFSTTVTEKYHYLTVPFTNKRGVLVRRDSPWAAYEKITPALLKQMPLITSSRVSYTQSFLSQWLPGDWEKLNIVANYNLIYNAVFLVEAGVGNAMCLENLVNTSGGSPVCFLPLDPPSYAALTLVWKREKPLSKAAELFLAEIRKVLGPGNEPSIKGY